MADSVKIRITGDDTDYGRTLAAAEKNTKASAETMSKSVQKAAAEQSTAMKEAWKEAETAASKGASAIANDSQTIVGGQSKANDAIKRTANDAFPEIEKKSGEAARAVKGDFDGMESRAHKFGASLKNALVGIGAATAATSAAITAVTAAVVKVTNGFAAAGDAINDTAPKLNLSRKAYQEWDYILSQNGSSIDAMNMGMKTLQNTMVDAAAGGKTATAAFKAIGLTAKEVAAMSPEQAFEATVKAFQAMPASAAKTAAAVDMFGRSGMDLLPLLNSTTTSIDELKNKAQELGLIMSDDMVDAAGQYADMLDTTKRAAAAAGYQITAEFIPALTGVLDAFTQMVAGKAGGMEAFSGAVDTLITDISSKLPGMLEAGTKLILSLVDGMVKNLPAAVKKLAAAFPGILKSLLSSAPQMVAALFEITSSLVSDLIAMLPELVPTILEGAAKMLLEVGIGIGKLLNEMFNGIGKLLGIKGDEYTEALNGLFGNVDKERTAELSATVKASLTTEISTDDYTTKINTAVTAIETALKGITALDDATRAEIKTAIINGTGLDLLSTAFAEAFPGVDMTPITNAMTAINAALEGLGLSDDAEAKIKELVAAGASAGEIEKALVSFGVNPIAAALSAFTISGAMSGINTALEGLGLSETAKTKITDLVAQGASSAEIETALVSFGVPADTAKTAAESITTEMGRINTAMNGLGLDENALAGIAKLVEAGATSEEIAAALVEYGVPADTATAAAASITTEMGKINAAVTELGLPEGTGTTLSASATSDKAAITAALKLYGLTDAEIQPILDSYDTVSGSLTGKAKGLLDQIAAIFTDGLPDDGGAAKEAVKAFYKDVYTKIDEWKAEAVKELEDSGLTGSDLTEKTAAIEESWTGMVDAAKASETGAMDWVEENAGRSTEFVKGNLTALQTILTEAQKITAQIDILTNDAFNTARSRRTLVKKGVVTNEAHQVEALGITSMELDERLQNADTEAAAAFDKAAETFANDSEGYAAEEKRILDKLAGDKAAAYTTYNQEVADIIAGIVKANPELAKQLSGVQELVETSNLADTLRQKIADALSESGASGEPVDISGFFDNLTASGVDLETLAKSLGMTPEKLKEAIANELKSGEGGGPVTTAINDLISGEGGINSQITAKMKEGGIDLSGTGEVLTTAINDGYLKAGINGVDWTNYETLMNTMLAGVGQAGVDGLGSKTDAAGVAAGVMGDTAVKKADVKAGMTTSGENSGQGWLDGWRNKAVDMVIAAYNAGKAVKKAFDRGQDAASPSKAFIESGKWSGQGWEIGYKASMSNALKTARSLARDMVSTVNLPARIQIPQVGALGATGGTLDVMGALRGLFENANFNFNDRGDMQTFAYEFMGILNNQIRAVGGTP